MKINKTSIIALVSLILLGTIAGCTPNDNSATKTSKNTYKVETQRSIYDLFSIENEHTLRTIVTYPVNPQIHDYPLVVKYSYLPSGALVMWKDSDLMDFVYVLHPNQQLLSNYALQLENGESTSLEVFLSDVNVIDLK